MKHTLCQNCGQNPATVFYHETKNGAERELHLCNQCAAKLGIGSFQEDLFASFSLFSPHKHESKKEEHCPLCGTTLSQIRHRGKFGCSSCYDTFGTKLDLTPFVGKGYNGEKPIPEKKSDESKIASLKAELKKAIAAEDYERAAVLRDEIRAQEVQ